jgi:hypothetical protein
MWPMEAIPPLGESSIDVFTAEERPMFGPVADKRLDRAQQA